MTFLDFFAGIGGFRLGMEMAGHTCLGHCEIDEAANRSYIAMHHPREDEWYAGDIRTVKPGDLPAAEVYCFGFPCQTFSIAGRRAGFNDTRGTLFFEVMRLAKERHPDLLFAENVKGLLNHDEGRTFGTIIRAMDELGYDAEWQICNSKHFGVPQNRERVFIIGHFRGGGCTEPIFPLQTSNPTANELPGHDVSNTITTRYGNHTNGTYPIDGGGVSQSQWLSSAAIASNKRGIKKTRTSCTLCARDYKGVSNSNLTVVVYGERTE